MKKDREIRRGKWGNRAALALCLGLTLGGWLFTRQLLIRQEEAFLNQEYLAALSLPGEETWEPIPFGGEADQQQAQPQREAAFSGRELDGGTVAEILKVWRGGGRELLHEPAAGQMTMEQALEASRRWLDEMVRQGVLPPEAGETGEWQYSASLQSLDRETDLDRELLSLWQVTCQRGAERIELTLHAVSGHVWQAQVTLQSSWMGTEDFDWEILPRVFPFLEADEGRGARIDETVYCSFEKGTLAGAFQRAQIQIDQEEPLYRVSFWLLPPETEEISVRQGEGQ